MQTNQNTSKEKANNNASNEMKEDVKSIKENGANFAETIMEQGHDTYDHIKESSSHYIKMLEHKVASKPLQSIAIAVGSGMVLSYLLKRG